MNLFCRFLGHTWVHKSEDPKIAWNTAKKMDELVATVHGEPRFYRECARCGEQRDLPRAPRESGGAQGSETGAPAAPST